MQKYIGLALLAISLTATPVQAQIQFQKPAQVSVDEKYRWQRQEPSYHSCHCGCRKSKMLAIVPNNSPSLTMSSHPKFFVNVPKIEPKFIESPDGKLKGEFRLIVQANYEEIYQTEIPISDEGIIEINLPSNVLGLEVGKDYEWVFVIFCNADDHFESINVGGLVRRVEPSAKLISQLKRANPLQTAVIYAKNGIWVEAISTLAQLRRESPQDLRLIAYWRSLLKSVDLQDITFPSLMKYTD
ncbi:DUF928 domain-containing protein [Anabaena cylindrica FACHB-243]|uniref:DUF928 domain-containing protein n=1 Tax=Anabaena cylindrica (strain ATCC 27899 / PCC 7122) TaxID=272123 RepID=K9ZJV2_ANACC|nr:MULTISPECIES: DUF928 domain-containing protein [Anabaena]AFZ59486.1 protein of unknown function DUF928 [Anabaena cylindrica PCC 7122]MBD2421199.1 DUF928 domain-containing protein [Anabaena cylindrica FACHB-243]MCM2410045.1 DUF928 domain-containing protein [Anabaena sp. CCAP 1446/1C]BAY03473.1 hypothetical protein NIES19_27260 [Anabaena cylindrica PCC 7122]